MNRKNNQKDDELKEVEEEFRKTQEQLDSKAKEQEIQRTAEKLMKLRKEGDEWIELPVKEKIEIVSMEDIKRFDDFIHRKNEGLEISIHPEPEEYWKEMEKERREREPPTFEELKAERDHWKNMAEGAEQAIIRQQENMQKLAQRSITEQKLQAIKDDYERATGTPLYPEPKYEHGIGAPPTETEVLRELETEPQQGWELNMTQLVLMGIGFALIIIGIFMALKGMSVTQAWQTLTNAITGG